jgi:hypothetical protein
MKRNHLTLILQPSCAVSGSVNRIRSISFHKRTIVWCALCGVLMVLFGISGSIAIMDHQTLQQEIAALQDELSHTQQLERKLENVRREERIVRSFLGIENGAADVDLDERLGMGGTEADDYDMQSFDPMTELEALVDKRPLHVQVLCLRDDLEELNSILARMTETLKSRPTIMPVKDDEIWITSGFGWRKSPFTGMRQLHRGLDISGRKGAPIIATAEGVVGKVGYDRFLGNYVRITHDERFETLYAHLLKAVVKKGEDVQRGQIIGFMGTSGMSTGYHVHYEVVDNSVKVNPYHFILNREDIRLSASRR